MLDIVSPFGKMSTKSGQAQSAPGRRRDVEVLNKSGIVLLVATWEAFVEDLAGASFSYLLKHARTPDRIPKTIAAKVVKRVMGDPNALRLWELTGDGWRSIVAKYGEDLLNARVRGSSFNTPSTRNVDELFAELVGLKGLSDHWHWAGKSAVSAKKGLAELLELRGQIAHRVQASKPVYKKDVDRAFGLVAKLAARSSDALRDHLRVTTGRNPWRKSPWK